MLATVAFIAFREHTNNPVQTETLIKACKCLHELTATNPLAADALSAVRGAFKRTGIPLPTCLQSFLGSETRHRKDGLLHFAAAKLMPDEDRSNEAMEEVRYQELLDELDGAELN